MSGLNEIAAFFFITILPNLLEYVKRISASRVRITVHTEKIISPQLPKHFRADFMKKAIICNTAKYHNLRYTSAGS